MTQTPIIFIVFLLNILSQKSALATSFYERPFPDAVKDAPIVLRAHVGMSYAHWVQGSDSSKRLYTYTEMQVDEVLKGNVNGSTVIVRELGGEKDGVGMQVPGTAQFKRGEDVVVFANDERDKDGAYDLRGMMMGKYNVTRNEEGHEVLSGAGLMGETNPALRGHDSIIHPEHFSEGGGHDDTADESKRPKWTLAKLRDLIRNQAHVEPKLTKSHAIISTSPSPQPSKTFSTVIVDRVVEQAPALQSSTVSQPWSWVTVSLLTLAALFIGWIVLRVLIRR